MRNRNAGDDEERKGPIEYPERDPMDLIEENKRPFARRKLCATCCGGIRFVYDEVTAQGIHPALYLMQFLEYLFFPGVIVLFGLAIWPDKNDRMEACAVVAALAFVLCSILHGISYRMHKQENERQAQTEAEAHA